MENKILPETKNHPPTTLGLRPVTRGPRNTSSGENLERIYQNFDRLEISFQCSIPAYIRKVLREAKEMAIRERKETIITLGKNLTPVEVAESGLRGGYQLRFDTGEYGMIWAIGDNDDSERWNVRVIVKSLCLAIKGYDETKAEILEFLNHTLYARPAKGQESPLERISRVDYCFDFIDRKNSFYPDESRFVVHSRCKRNIINNIKNISEIFSNVFYQGKYISTITIGKLNGRQVTVYHKSKEIKEKGKLEWWRIWGLKHEQDKYNIWRIEARAGKKELNKYNLKRFSDLEKKAGDVVINILKDYKYITPNKKDANRSRWDLAPLWQACIRESRNHLKRFISHAERKDIVLEHMETVKVRYKKHLNGTMISYCAILGLDTSELKYLLKRESAFILG